MKKRIVAILLSVVMLVITASKGLYFDTTDVAAAETPSSIKMPVVVYDHLDDNLLFEYDLAGASYFALEDLGYLTGKDEGKGLVEETLGPNGTPIYKEEVVIEVAKMVETYMEEGHNVDNDLYNELVSRIVAPGSEVDLISKDVYSADLEMLGWSFPGLTYAEVDDRDSWVDSQGNVIWYRKSSDQLYTNGGVDNKAVFDFGTLEAGTYTLDIYDFENINIEVTGNGFSTIIDDENDSFTVPTAGNVKLTIYAKDNNEGSIVAPDLEKDDEKILDNFTKNQTLSMDKIGWVYPADSTWGTDKYGGMSCEDGETSVAYKVVDVVPGRTYELNVGHNENDLCNISVTDVNGNLLAGEDESFVIPADVNQIKVVVACVENPEGDYRRLDNVSLEMFPSATLGDYATSKAKFDGGAKFDDIVTCMDYAYYMLNTFWTDTYGDVTQKTDLYKTITLRKTGDKYKFSSSNTPVYDLENGDIIYGTESGDGFYPIDKTVLGDKSDLTAPYGEGEIENPYDDLMHNYHFSLRINCAFLYEEAKNLEFGFRGDDDVYVYIDGKLVMDLGGAHLNREDSFELNDLADELGLVDGEVYSFDFFYMERHTTASNMKIETNMIFTPAEATPDVIIKDKDGNVLESPVSLEKGSEVGLDYEITAGSDNMSNITFNDTNLGVTVGKDGVDLGDEGVYVKDDLTVNVYDKDGNIKETITISKEDLDDPEKVADFCDKVGEIVIDKGEKVEVTGLYKDVDGYETINPSLVVDITAPQAKYDENGNFVYEDEVVTMIPVEKVIIPTTVPAASLDVTLVDSSNNEIAEEVNENTYVGVNYTVTADADGMKNIAIVDNGTGFVMDKEGITIPEGYNVDNGLTVTLTKVDGTSETVTLTKEDIDNKTEKYNQLLTNVGEGWVLDEGDTVVITGLNTTITQGTITSDATATVEGPKTEYDDETGELKVEYIEVAPTDKEEVSTKAASNVFFQVNPNMGSLEGETFDRVYNGETTGEQPAVVPEEGYEFVKWTQTVGGITTDVVGEPKDVVINADTVFTAILQPKTYDYVVKYVDKATGEEIAERKTGNATFGTDVTEQAVAVDNYTVSGKDEKTITMKVSGNEIIFEYEINKVNVTFETDGNGTLDGETSQTVNYGGNASEVTPKANEGYSFDGWTMTNSEGTVKVDDPTAETITEDTTFTATFTPNTYDYVVKYIDKATGEEIAESKTAQAVFGTEVTEEAISIPHYGVSGDATKSITMSTTGNEIIFEYEIGKLNVTFETDGNGLLEGEVAQTVNYGGNAEAVAPVPSEGYSFEGWTMTNSEGTVKVDDPTAETITEDTMFTANFKANKYDYVIKYVDKTTGNELAESKTGTANYGTDITENAIDIEGYTLSNAATQSMTVKTTGNEIVFEYDIIKLDVDFITSGNGSLEGETDQTVNYGDKAEAVTPKTDEGYSFEGWTKTDSEGTVKVQNPADEVIKEDTTFIATFTPNTYDYVVKYVDKETGKEIAESKTGSALFGREVTEKAIQIDHYGVSNDATQTIVMKVEGNEIVFEYEIGKVGVTFDTDGNGTLDGETSQTVNYGGNASEVTPEANEGYSFDGWTMTNSEGTVEVTDPTAETITEDTVFTATFTPNTYDYVVKYVDKTTGEEIAESKTGNALFGTEVTEEAVTVEGYILDGDATQTTTIKVEGNEIIFEYDIIKLNVNFETNGNGSLEGEVDQTVNYGDKATTVIPKADAGYSFVGWEMTTEDGTVSVEYPENVEITKDTTFTATFTPNTYDYVVKYVDKETGKEIAESKTGSALFGREVTEKAIQIDHYGVSNDATQTIVMKVEGNEIVFEYEIGKVGVTFDTDGNGTLDGETSQTVNYGGNASEVTPEANEGYTFDGWTMTNSEGTVDVEDPTKIELTEDTVFTANFKVNAYDYVVKYVDKTTGEELATAKSGSANYGTNITENAIDIEGYTLTNDATQSMTVKTSGNEIVFEYEIIKLDVDFITSGNGSLEGETDQTVNYGDKAEEVTPKADEGHSFDGWEMTTEDGTVKVEDPSKVEIKEDTTFTATFTPNTYDYVVKYIDKATGEEIAESKTESAKYGTEVTEEAISIDHYGVIGDTSKTITMKTEGNEIIFEYELGKVNVTFETDGNGSLDGETAQKVEYGKTAQGVTPEANEGYSFNGWTMTNSEGTVEVVDPATETITEDTTFTANFKANAYDYVVRYVDKATGADLADSKKAQADFGTEVSEIAVDIEGYKVDGDSTKSLTMKVSGNEIVFEYNINKYNVSFVAKENGTVEGQTEQVVDYKETAESVNPVANEGYSFNGWEMTTSQGTVTVENPAAVEITEDTTFTANFKANDYEYVVKYVDKATGEELLPSKSAQATFGTEVTEEAVVIEGYTLDGDSTKTTTIKVEGNEIVFEYNINKFNVSFVADENGTVEGQTEQVVDYKKTAEAVTPVPATGYEFLGWEMTNSQGTSLCEDPTAVEIVEDTTFTAKFGPLDYGYVVKYVDEEGKDLAAEVRGPETTFGTEVSAEAIEITGYECDETSKTITIDVENNEIVFVYKKKVYEVKFETDGNGVIVGNDTASVKFAEKVEKVPDQKANKGYEFTGWTMTTSTGTTTVEDPAQVEITENTVFTAHYKYVQTSGDIDKPGNDPVRGNEDPDAPSKNDIDKNTGENNSNSNDKNNDKNNNNNVLDPDDSDNNNGNGTNQTSLSPKTGYDSLLAMIFAMLMAAMATIVIAFRRVARN